MLAKDKEDFVDTICSMSDSNGGGGDNSLDNVRYYKIKDGVFSSENAELFGVLLFGAILANIHYKENADKNITILTPVMVAQMMAQVNETPIYLKYVASAIMKNGDGEYVDSIDAMLGAIEGGKEAYLTPCTKEEFYNTNWTHGDFQ